ncbi:DUF47 family protein [Candidatus Pacearchaeota archaeon]|nr:DUF47 family protein [Candidatus Pacearchaeota archaeon]
MGSIINWIVPREEKFFEMLSRQATINVEGGNEFKRFIDNYNSINPTQRAELLKKIDSIKDREKELSRKIITDINTTFITPIDKEDIHQLTVLLSDVIRLVYKTTKRLIIFKVDKTDSFIEKQAEIVVRIINKVNEQFSELMKMKNLERFHSEIHQLENDGDTVYQNALFNLFNTRKDAVEIIKYKEIYELLEKIVDKCKSITNVVENIVVKHG